MIRLSDIEIKNHLVILIERGSSNHIEYDESSDVLLTSYLWNEWVLKFQCKFVSFNCHTWKLENVSIH